MSSVGRLVVDGFFGGFFFGGGGVVELSGGGVVATGGGGGATIGGVGGATAGGATTGGGGGDGGVVVGVVVVVDVVVVVVPPLVPIAIIATTPIATHAAAMPATSFHDRFAGAPSTITPLAPRSVVGELATVGAEPMPGAVTAGAEPRSTRDTPAASAEPLGLANGASAVASAATLG